MKSNSIDEEKVMQWIMPVFGIMFALTLYFLYNQHQLLNKIACLCFK